MQFRKFKQDYFLWFDLLSKEYFLLSHSEIIKDLKVLGKPSLFNFDYLENFSTFIQSNNLQSLSIKFNRNEIAIIYKISENQNNES